MRHSANKRSYGQQGEELVWQRYKKQWYTLKEKNYTIWWGEIDLIVADTENLIFVEVKIVDYIHDLHGYLTEKKLWHLKKTALHFLTQHPTSYALRFDVVFVKHGKIYEVYEDIAL